MKKALSVFLVAAGLVVAGISMGTTAAGSGPKATAAGQKTYAKFTSKKLYKPRTFFFGAHEVIEKVSWSKWGKKLAKGKGTYQVNDCIPDCADGTITPTPSSLLPDGPGALRQDLRLQPHEGLFRWPQADERTFL